MLQAGLGAAATLPPTPTVTTLGNDLTVNEVIKSR